MVDERMVRSVGLLINNNAMHTRHHILLYAGRHKLRVTSAEYFIGIRFSPLYHSYIFSIVLSSYFRRNNRRFRSDSRAVKPIQPVALKGFFFLLLVMKFFQNHEVLLQ